MMGEPVEVCGGCQMEPGFGGGGGGLVVGPAPMTGTGTVVVGSCLLTPDVVPLEMTAV